MSKDGTTFPVEIEELGRRWSAALKRRYPPKDTAKLISRDFDVSPRTATAWLGGAVPYAKYLVLAWKRFGQAIVAEVLAPESEWSKAAALNAALVQVEDKLRELGDELVYLRGEVT